LTEVEFVSPVTFLVGENGSGKSTLLEALACAAGSITVGSYETNQDATLRPITELSRDIQLIWSKRTRKVFFMRSRIFFGFARRIGQARAGWKDLRQVEVIIKIVLIWRGAMRAWHTSES
jgi:predicted ATPase